MPFRQRNPGMQRPMTQEEALAFQARWRVANERQTGELRCSTPDQKLRQLDTLMRSVDAMGWRSVLAEDDWNEHELWNTLRKKLHG